MEICTRSNGVSDLKRKIEDPIELIFEASQCGSILTSIIKWCMGAFRRPGIVENCTRSNAWLIWKEEIDDDIMESINDASLCP